MKKKLVLTFILFSINMLSNVSDDKDKAIAMDNNQGELPDAKTAYPNSDSRSLSDGPDTSLFKESMDEAYDANFADTSNY